MNIPHFSASQALPSLGHAAGVRPLLFVFVAMLGTWSPHAEAAIRKAGWFQNPLYQKGYLDVTTYGVIADDNSVAIATANTQLINEAIKDAYNLNNDTPLWGSGFPGQTLQGSLVLYFPAGTYYINDTLEAYTATGAPHLVGTSDPKIYVNAINHATPRNHIAMVGSTLGARPVIRLINNAGNFDDLDAPKPLLDFRNFEGTVTVNSPTAPITIEESDEQPSKGYNQMLRGINLNCNGVPNVIGLYFNQAQDSSVENVGIEATGAYAGIQGLPGRGWGAVNIKVNGGKYGLDLGGGTHSDALMANAGTVVVGVTLTNQTDSAISADGFAPVTLVGFDIRPSSGAPAAITIVDGVRPHTAMVNLIDGSIQLTGPSKVAIDNSAGHSFYVRNVYVKGSNKMVKKPVASYWTIGTWDDPDWHRIVEYSYNDVVSGNILGYGENGAGGTIPQINQRKNADSDPTEVEEQGTAGTDVAASGFNPDSLVTKHAWGKLPSVDDLDLYDPVNRADPDITLLTNGKAYLTTQKLTQILNAHPKVFLPKGIYYLNDPDNFGPVKLKASGVLFGACRFLTRIEVNPNWTSAIAGDEIKQKETVMITTTNNGNATTYIGDLSLAVDTDDDRAERDAPDPGPGDWFTALEWKDGENSIVHIGQVYRSPAKNNRIPTNDHSVIKITGEGGGRWYFAGARKTGHGGHPNFRILEVNGTDSPLWFYGLNLEHPSRCDYFAEFVNAANIRIYTGKTEYVDTPHDAETLNDTDQDGSGVVRFNAVDNAALFGLAAIRTGLSGGKGAVDFLNCTKVLATLIAPQRFDTSNLFYSTAPVTLRHEPGTADQVPYPNVVSKYSNGSINDSVMTHAANRDY